MEDRALVEAGAAVTMLHVPESFTVEEELQIGVLVIFKAHKALSA
jgi:hypothetical protein